MPIGLTQPPPQAESDAGFTLVELLVALSLLSLIAIFIGEGIFSVRTMAPMATRIDSSAEMAMIRDHLHRTLGEAVDDLPLNESAPFIGGPASVSFLAPADPLLELGGVNRITLGLEQNADARLDLIERRALARGERTGAGSPTVLIRNVVGLALRYSAETDGTPPTWQTEWTDGGLPALISLEIALAPSDGRRIAPLVVHPAASAKNARRQEVHLPAAGEHSPGADRAQ